MKCPTGTKQKKIPKNLTNQDFWHQPKRFPKTEALHTTMWCFEISGLIAVNAEEGWGKWEADKKLGGLVFRPATIFKSLFWSSFAVYLWDLWSGRGWGFESRKCVCWDTLGRTSIQTEARGVSLIKRFIYRAFTISRSDKMFIFSHENYFFTHFY